MIIEALFAAAAAREVIPDFTPGEVPIVTSERAGTCSQNPLSLVWSTGLSAQVRISWTGLHDNSDYEMQVKKDGVLVATTTIKAGYAVYTVTGLVEDGTDSPITSDWVFSLHIVRKSDDVVVSTRTAEPWEQIYGGCPAAA